MGMTLTALAFADAAFLAEDEAADLAGLPSYVASVDVQKMWQALSIVTTPGDDPLTSIQDSHPLDPILGGTEFGEDLGYGPRRYFDQAQVRQVNAWLTQHDDAAARARFDVSAFGAADVYPFCWDEDPDELWEDELVFYLGQLRGFYEQAAANGHHVVLELL